MVFLTAQLFVRCRGPDEFWRKRQIFKLAAVNIQHLKRIRKIMPNKILIKIKTFQHYIGRRRNCYSLTIKSVHRALQFSTKGRKLKKQDMREVLCKKIFF